MQFEVIYFESQLKSFNWADGLYIIISEDDTALNLCALDEKGQARLFDDGRFMISCTGKKNKGIIRTNLRYNYID